MNPALQRLLDLLVCLGWLATGESWPTAPAWGGATVEAAGDRDSAPLPAQLGVTPATEERGEESLPGIDGAFAALGAERPRVAAPVRRVARHLEPVRRSAPPRAVLAARPRGPPTVG